MLVALSTFPGLGLLDRAFEEEGVCVVRGPDPLWGGDIRRFHTPAGRFDLVIGGPPCQTFSGLANLQRGRGIEPEFGNLIPEYVRVVLEAQPIAFVMENVAAAPVPVVEGYIVHAQLLNNRWFGGVQNRVRRISFGTRDGRRLMPTPVALEQLEWKAAVTSAHGGYRRTNASKITGGKITRYKPEEAAVLQGLSAELVAQLPFRRDRVLKAVANGVPLPMGRAIARAVKEALAA